MPKLTIAGKTVEVKQGKRMVLAIEEAGVRLGHRCGGKAKCTTCRVKFLAGEPATMTQAEYDRLNAAGYYGEARLSCQIVCDHEMSVEPLITVENQPQWNGDNGPTPDEQVMPEARWYPIAELEKAAV